MVALCALIQPAGSCPWTALWDTNARPPRAPSPGWLGKKQRGWGLLRTPRCPFAPLPFPCPPCPDKCVDGSPQKFMTDVETTCSLLPGSETGQREILSDGISSISEASEANRGGEGSSCAGSKSLTWAGNRQSHTEEVGKATPASVLQFAASEALPRTAPSATPRQPHERGRRPTTGEKTGPGDFSEHTRSRRTSAGTAALVSVPLSLFCSPSWRCRAGRGRKGEGEGHEAAW